MAVTIYDVAKKAGVSITTVSHVINKKHNIPERTRKRVLEVMRSINYVPNKIAQRLVTKKTETIALLIPTMDNPFFAELYNGVEQLIEEARPDYSVMIGNIRYSAQKEVQLIQKFRQEFIDGYIIVSNDPENEEILQLFDESIPVVFAVNDQSILQDRPLVTYNNYEMAYKLTEHLAELGHRKFAYIGAMIDHSSRARRRFMGFRDCLTDRGIHFDERYFKNGDAYSSRCGYESFLSLHNSGTIPTALFCANDVLAMGVLYAIKECGYPVPDQMSIVGYDNIPATEFVHPPLTTVNINPTRIGYESARMLFQIIDGEEIQNYQRIIEGELIIRSSSRGIDI
jgi:LacI family transcriptional regulator